MTYSALIKGSSSGVVLEPGNVDSVLVECISWLDEDTRMPPKDAKLSNADIGTIKKWILGGLLEKKTSKKLVKQNTVAEFKLPQAPAGSIIMPENLSIEPTIRHEKSIPVQAMQSSPYAPIFAVGAYKQVILFNNEDLDVVGVLDFPEGQIYDLKFSRDGALLLAAGGMNGNKGFVALWDVKSGDRLQTIEQGYDAIMAADLSSDGQYIAMGSSDKFVHIYRTNTGELLESFKAHAAWLSSMRFSPSGLLLASGDQNGQVILWDLKEMDKMYNFYKHKGQINALTWRPDSKVLVSGSSDGSFMLWSLESGESIKQVKAHSSKKIWDVNYTPEGHLLSTGDDQSIRVWDVANKQIHYLKSGQDVARKVLYSNDKTKLMTASLAGDLFLWDLKTKKIIAQESVLLPLLEERIYKSETQLDFLRQSESQLKRDKQKAELTLKMTERLPLDIENLQTSIQALKKRKDLFRINRDGGADGQLSEDLRNTQRQRKSEALNELSEELRSDEKALRTARENLKNKAKLVKDSQETIQKTQKELAKLSPQIPLEEKKLHRWQVEKINTRRYVEQNQLIKLNEEQEQAQYELSELKEQGSLKAELKNEIDLRAKHIESLKAKQIKLSQQYQAALKD